TTPQQPSEVTATETGRRPTVRPFNPGAKASWSIHSGRAGGVVATWTTPGALSAMRNTALGLDGSGPPASGTPASGDSTVDVLPQESGGNACGALSPAKNPTHPKARSLGSFSTSCVGLAIWVLQAHTADSAIKPTMASNRNVSTPRDEVCR